MKHFCFICWFKWSCGIKKGKPICSGRYLTMCDNCLTDMNMK